jgi:transposase
MTTVKLNDEQWHQVRYFLRADARTYVGNESECRQFVEGVIWINRSGAQWRLLPAGQRHDIIPAYDLIVDFDFNYLIADRSYAAQAFRD